MTKKSYISLAVKNALMYLVIITLSSFIIGYTIYRLSAVLIVSSAKKQLNEEVKGIAQNLTEVFDQIGRDVQFLAQSPVISSYLSSSSPGEAAKALVQEEFKAMLQTKPAYFQIRLIGLADSGMERVRVDRIHSKPEVIPPDRLQRKGDRVYFRETVKIPAGGVYFSEIDLNQEFGKLQIPYLPTLRVGSPLYMNDMLYGIIIINIELKQVFQKLQQDVGLEKEIYVFNNEGYFLIHPDESQTFGFEFGKAPNVASVFNDVSEWFPDIALSNNADSIRHNTSKFITSYYTLTHPRTSYKLLFALRAAEDQILSPFKVWRKNTILTTLGITLLFLGFAFYWMQRQSKQLKKITQSMVQFAGDHSHIKSIQSQPDEIGDLSKAFNEMADTIRSNLIALEKSNAIANEANKSKEEFLENISHEIKNPVQSIIGMTNILEDNDPKPEQKPVIKSLQFSSKQLLHLVNDVLDFTKFKTGQIKLAPAPTRLYNLLSQTIESNQYLAYSKNIRIYLDFDQQYQKLEVLLDAMRLNQILNNLIVNAIKFSKDNSEIGVKVGILSKDEEKVRVEFNIIDEGVGMSEEELAQIKSRYFSNDLNGSGLGLHIVNQFLRLFQSELQIQSTKNKGSRFSFVLDLPYLEPDEVKTSENERMSPVMEVEAGLLIDDDPQIIHYLEYVLKKIGVLHIYAVTNLQELNQLGDENKFDIIITDALVSPDNLDDYFRQVQILRKEKGLLLLHSGITDLPARILTSVGIDAFVPKPIESTDFIKLIENLWYEKKISIPDMKMFYKDYDYDSGLLQSAMKILLAEWKQMTDKLLLSIRTNDQDSFNQVYHKLIASLRRFNLTPLQEFLLHVQQEMMHGGVIDDKTIEVLSRKLEWKEQFFKAELIKIEKGEIQR